MKFSRSSDNSSSPGKSQRFRPITTETEDKEPFMKQTRVKQESKIFDNMVRRLSGPGSRWNSAQKNAAWQQPSQAYQQDNVTRQAAAYLWTLRHHGPERAQQKYPLVPAAYALFQDDKLFETFRMSLLGKLPMAEIAERMDVAREIIELAEALFFDLGDQPSAAWLNHHVFAPEVKSGSTETAVKMKLAYHGGAMVTRDLLNAHDHLPLNEAERLVDQKLLLHAKLLAALEFDLDDSTAAEFIKNYLDYDLARRNIELEREKFQHECKLDRKQCAGKDGQHPTDVQ